MACQALRTPYWTAQPSAQVAAIGARTLIAPSATLPRIAPLRPLSPSPRSIAAPISAPSRLLIEKLLSSGKARLGARGSRYRRGAPPQLPIRLRFMLCSPDRETGVSRRIERRLGRGRADWRQRPRRSTACVGFASLASPAAAAAAAFFTLWKLKLPKLPRARSAARGLFREVAEQREVVIDRRADVGDRRALVEAVAEILAVLDEHRARPVARRVVVA